MSNGPPGSRRQEGGRGQWQDREETMVVDAKPHGAIKRDRESLPNTDGPGAGEVISLGDGMVATLGRAADCTVCIADGSLSREHARLVRPAGLFVLKDAGSK